jgi:hypothetical protein
MLQALRKAYSGPGGAGCSVTEYEDRGRRAEEQAKLYFEIFKHLASLSTAGALVVLAVYREVSVGRWPVLLSLALFALTILACFVGMVAAAGYFNESYPPTTERQLFGWLYVVSVYFFAALLSFIMLPLLSPLQIQLPQWLLPVGYLLLLLVLDLLVTPAYRYLRKR